MENDRYEFPVERLIRWTPEEMAKMGPGGRLRALRSPDPPPPNPKGPLASFRRYLKTFRGPAWAWFRPMRESLQMDNDQQPQQQWTPERLARWTPEQLEKGARCMELLRQARDVSLAERRLSSSPANTAPSQPTTKLANSTT